MTSSKPDDLFYKTLITEAWTSDVVFVILLGLVGWLFICLFLDAYLILNIFLTWVGFVIAFVGATTIIILTKWPAIHVYRSGKEYQVDKIRDKVGARAISQREMHKTRARFRAHGPITTECQRVRPYLYFRYACYWCIHDW